MVDPLAIFLATLIALIGFLVAIFAVFYIKEGATQNYHMLYILLLVGATGIVLTGDIFNMFVFFEILCISSYALVAYNRDKPGVEAGIKYLIQGTIGSGFILIGIALLYGQYGTLNIAHLAQYIQSASMLHVFVPLVFLITGFGIEGYDLITNKIQLLEASDYRTNNPVEIAGNFNRIGNKCRRKIKIDPDKIFFIDFYLA